MDPLADLEIDPGLQAGERLLDGRAPRPPSDSALDDGRIKKCSYTHEDMIDFILANPGVSQGQVAARYGYTQAWISRIISSDAFRTMYAKRRSELVDPVLLQETETRLRALADRSLDLLQDKIETANLDGLIKVLEVSSRAMGYGVAKGAQVNVQTNYVVALPNKSPSPEAWAEKYGEGLRKLKDITNGTDEQAA